MVCQSFIKLINKNVYIANLISPAYWTDLAKVASVDLTTENEASSGSQSSSNY